MPPLSGTAAFRQARDQLLALRADIDRATSEFRWPDVGDSFNWATDWFDVIAADNETVALWIVEDDGSERKYSYADLRRRSNQLANWLRSHGVRRGDPVMLMLDNQVELWEAMLAVMKLGAIILPTSVVLGSHELADRVQRAGVRQVIANAADAGKFDQVDGDYLKIVVGASVPGWLPFADSHGAAAGDIRTSATSSTSGTIAPVGSQDPALIYFTSGTTNKPKMVVHTHASYPVGHLTTMYWIGVQPGDVHLVIASPGWGKHAWSSFFAPWIAEATVFVYNYRRFNPEALVAQLDRARVTSFCAPPTVWRMLIQHDITTRPGRLREILSAGEPLNPEVIARIHQWWGLTIRDGYGQTETTALIANAPGSPVKPGAMGRPLPGVDIALVDPLTGRPAREGEICLDLSVRPVNLMAGYLNDPGKTAEATRDGYFHTGDVAWRDEEGFITFIGRTDDIFKSADYKVSPFEVESILIEHPAVLEAAVVGAPDDTRLNITKAYVALAADWDPTGETAFAVLRHARVALPPYMRVRRIEFFELPKTASGKIRRVELRQREIDAAGAGIRFDTEWREEDFPDLKKP